MEKRNVIEDGRTPVRDPPVAEKSAQADRTSKPSKQTVDELDADFTKQASETVCDKLV